LSGAIGKKDHVQLAGLLSVRLAIIYWRLAGVIDRQGTALLAGLVKSLESLC